MSDPSSTTVTATPHRAHAASNNNKSPNKASLRIRKARASNSSSGSSIVLETLFQGCKSSNESMSDFALDGEDVVEDPLVPEDLDDVWDFVPKVRDTVWVKEKDSEHDVWFQGEVLNGTRKTTVRGGKQGMSYSVRYQDGHRRYFAPLLGEIKPDTAHVRRLLDEAGCDYRLFEQE